MILKSVKSASLFVLSGLVLICSCNQNARKGERQITVTENKLSMTDSNMAKKVGADEFGFRQYAIVFLTEGPNKSIDSATLAANQKEHMMHLEKLIKEGKVLFAGPLMTDVRIKGLTLFNCSVNEAKTLSEEDPSVKIGHMQVEAYPWYGPATLMNIPELQKAVEVKSIFDMFRQ